MFKKIEKYKHQFLKFFFIGIINSVIDFSILNSLIYAFQLDHRNLKYLVFKLISFLVACGHSFYWNKTWVFKKSSSQNIKSELSLFYLIASGGLIINILVSTIVFSISKNYLSEIFSANLGALTGLVFVTVWDFIGYKFIVFKK